MKQKYQIQQLQTYQSHQQSNSHPHPNLTIDSSTTNNTHVFDDFSIENPALHAQKRKYGNIRVLYENSKFLFTIGPDYVCFIIAYILFTIMSFTIIYTAAVSIQNACLNIINVIISVFQNLSYLAIALSNPGIQTKNTIPTEQDNSDQIKRFCKKCGIRMQKGTHHCRDCDVCIRNYDHHCPWTSKCIGEKNLCKFYVFVTSTMSYLVYCLIILLICSAKGAIEQQNIRGKSL